MNKEKKMGSLTLKLGCHRNLATYKIAIVTNSQKEKHTLCVNPPTALHYFLRTS